jgi:hypothetical protein
MSVRLVGYQPQYFPRLHYYARVLNCDLYTISDNLQYVRKHIYPKADGTTYRGPSYQAHTPIKNPQGVLLLDVPVKHLGKDEHQLMTEARIDYDSRWREDHLKNIEHNYRKAPQFDAVFPSLRALFEREFDNLAAFTIATTLWGLGVLLETDDHTNDGIHAKLPHEMFRLKKVIPMSKTDIPAPDKKSGYDANQWIIDKCNRLGADEYYHGGVAAAAYFSHEKMEQAGIRSVQQNWRLEPYPQQFPKTPFMGNLSIIDLLMNVTPENAREILHTKE